MFKKTLSTCHLSCLGAVLLSLGGCAASPDLGGIDMQTMYERMGAVGQRSAELGGRVWDRTRNALGFDHRAGDEMLDEVDLAMMEEDAVLPPSGPDAREREAALGRWENPTPAAVAAPARNTPSSKPVSPLEATEHKGTVDDAALLGERTPVAKAALRITAPPAATPPRPDERHEDQPAKASASYADIRYRVQENESLWAIARSVTGDASNWHRIADINDLAPNATVYAGQTLTIPGDLINPLPDTATAAMEDDSASSDTSTPEPAEGEAATAEPGPDAVPDAGTPAKATVTRSPALAAASPARKPSMKAPDKGKVFRIRQGESLWDFAKRVTGDATNWERIAKHNRIAPGEVTRMQSGQRLRVPFNLLDRADSRTNDDTAAIEAAATRLSDTEKRPQRPPVRIVEADFREQTQVQHKAVRTSTKSTDEAVLVRGTYYPKAVYRRADFSSELLMRVSPGTALTVARAFGPWYEVITEKGTGYIHSRDIR